MELDTVVIIGETGVGKSTIANAILGKNVFTPFHGIDAGTLVTEYSYGYLFNDRNNPEVRIVDTQGYNDPNGRDKQHADQMIKTIKKFPEVHLFLLVFNGNNIRWNSATWEILGLFDKMFPDFWNNCLILINFWSENENDEFRRELTSRTEGSVKDDIRENLKKKFGKNLYSIEFLDAICFNYPDDHPEKNKLIEKINMLQIVWSNAKPYYTDRITASQKYKDDLIDKQKNQIDDLLKKIKSSPKEKPLPKKQSILPRESDYHVFNQIIKPKPKIARKKKSDLGEFLDDLLIREIKEISRCLDLPTSLTKQKMIENIKQNFKSVQSLIKELPKDFAETLLKEDTEDLGLISNDDSSDYEIAAPIIPKPSIPKKNNYQKLFILEREELRKICVKLGLGISGNKQKLIDNLSEENKSFKKIFKCLSKPSLKEICSRLSISVNGNKDELIQKLMDFI
jgi:hypothetical protein